MISVVLDTNAWIILCRQKINELGPLINLEFAGLTIFDPKVNIVLPFAVKAELFSIARKNAWGKVKMETVEDLISKPLLVHSHDKIVQAYIDIDSFSLNCHPTIALPNKYTHRVMGKNDLWIAATAFDLDAYLITNDNDFDHLVHLGLKVVKF